MTYSIVRPLEWRVADDGNVEVRDHRGGPPIRFTPKVAPLLASIRDLEPVPQLARHFPKLPQEAGEARAKQFLLHLRRLGYVEVSAPSASAIAERYEIVRELGRGGVGVAWMCRDGDALVVVKAPWDFLVPMKVADAAIRAEDAALRTLVHPGFVGRVGSFEHEGRLHLVREYVEGEDLGRHERAAVDVDGAQASLREAASIVAAAHALGYVLLDLRPGNFVRADRLVLLDVGLARPLVDGVAMLDAAVGVAGFVAPEVLRERRATPKSDVWSLGALYAFLRTGRHDARGGPLALREQLPAAESAFVARLCAEDPRARPDAADL